MNYITLILILIINPVFSQNTFETTVVVNPESEQFGNKVTKALINQDCSDYYNLISDSVVLFLDTDPIRDTLLPREGNSHIFEQLCNSGISQRPLNYRRYLKKFEQIHFDFDAMNQLKIYQNISFNELRYYELKPNDVFYLGDVSKKSENLSLIENNAFRFLFRKINGEYKIVLIVYKL